MGRRIVAAVGCVLLVGALGACAQSETERAVVLKRSYPTRFAVPDPEFDAESTSDRVVVPPNVDLTAISAAVGRHGIETTFTYAKGWRSYSTSRWGIRFETRGSDGSRLSGAWTHVPVPAGLTSRVDLAPRPPGCSSAARFASRTRRLTLVLSPACLPRRTRSDPRPWVRFDTIEAVSSWHAGSKILYAWDQLYSRVIAPEPERLYLPD